MKYIYFLDLCRCDCNTIIYGNKKYVHNHHRIGISRPCYEETKKKISNTLIGNIPWNKGKIGCVSERGKENIRKANRNRSPPNKGVFGVKVGELASNWQGGISFEPYCKRFNKKLKEKIRERDNEICQNCGKTKIENKWKLSVHHIHYDKENCYPNLISLCISCNSKVNFNRNYWEEHFMEKLKKRNLLNWKIEE